MLTSLMFPDIWKKASVTPIFKKGDPTRVENYRPICIFAILRKLLSPYYTKEYIPI